MTMALKSCDLEHESLCWFSCNPKIMAEFLDSLFGNDVQIARIPDVLRALKDRHKVLLKQVKDQYITDLRTRFFE